MVDEKISVYVRVANNGNIYNINSSIFLTDLTGWIKVDEGYGDKYAHAQNNYLAKPLINRQGGYNYKLENGVIREV